MKPAAPPANLIDRISTGIGKGAAWLGPLLIAELVYDTVARYLFNAPTEWSYDISYMLYGALFMLGAPYTLLRDENVRIELIYEKLSARARALIDVIGYVIFFFPSVGAILYFGSSFAYRSWALWERSGVSMWSPPIYPFKTILPLAAFLLLLQGITEFARCLTTVRRGDGGDFQS
jgi:TRAP-type mannitol/chloroaromatic compound transport system permease small subunit